MVNQNVARGAILLAVALYFLVQAPGLRIGTLVQPGPGLFPMVVGGLLLLVTAAILVRAMAVEKVPLDFRMRNIALVAASLIGFTVISSFVNMLAGIIVMTAFASYASDDFSVKRAAAIALALCLVAFALKRGLGVQLPLY